MKIWSPLHGDMQGRHPKECRPPETCQERLERNSLSGNQTELPELEVIPADKPANNGEALLVCGASRTPWKRKGNPVGSRHTLVTDPVTTDRPFWT
jgi:hypothetical protein